MMKMRMMINFHIKGDVMKKYVVLFLVILSTNLLAVENPGVHQRLFDVLSVIYSQQLGEDPCGGLSVCQIEVDRMQCLRNVRCDITFVSNAGELKDVRVTKRQNGYLGLYIILRKAFAAGIGDMTKFGPRYRPHFKINAPLICSTGATPTECL